MTKNYLLEVKKVYKNLCRFFGPESLSHGVRKKNPCFNFLKAKIKMSGPIGVDEYMKYILTNPTSGYYMKGDVFGQSGDFITSPEISQLFGEMVSVWTLNEWQQLGFPSPFQLIELGPGRGTMMNDILRVYEKLKKANEMSVHLVEVSEELSVVQANKLCVVATKHYDKPYYKSGKTQNSVPVYWYNNLKNVPNTFSCILAHEFFDVLPVHVFKKTNDGWRELFVDLAPPNEDKFQLVVSKSPTAASTLFSKWNKGRDHFELSPESGVIMEEIALRLEGFGGFSLVIDYGHNGDKNDTLRGFRKHEVVDPLSEPGSADITADVDFSFLKGVVQDKLTVFGPVSQHHFLKDLHIDLRLQMLLKKTENLQTKEDILSGYHMIMDKEKMGERFKVMAFYPSVLNNFLKMCPPVGFSDYLK